MAQGAVQTYRKLAAVPLAFLGIGVQRAWSGSLFDQFAGSPETYMLGFAFLVVVNFVAAALAPRHGSFQHKPLIALVTALTGSVGSILVLVAAGSAFSEALSLIGASLAFCSVGLSMLMWCEFFAMLGPTRVAFTYSLAIVLDAVVSFFMSGLMPAYLGPLLVVMPIVNVVWAYDSISRIARQGDAPAYDRPASVAWPVTFPWHIVALMAAISFAGQFNSFDTSADPAVSLVGSLTVPLFLVAATSGAWQGATFDRLYRFAMPAVIVAMLLVLPAGDLGVFQPLACLLFTMGDTALAVMTMVVFSGISHRYGISPLRLNGIERGIRYSAYIAGWALHAFLVPQLGLQAKLLLDVTLAILTVVVFAVTFIPNSNPLADWGVHIKAAGSQEDTKELERARLVASCRVACERFGLTVREHEVLLQLAQGKSSLAVERELGIAQGTLKAHVSHIYAKCGVHNRPELLDLLAKQDYKL